MRGYSGRPKLEMSPKLRLPECIQIHTSGDVKDGTLRERAERAKGGRSLEFIVIHKDQEVALLSYEDWSEQSVGFVYEIFVLPPFRKNGLGSFLLLYAENLALKLGCTRIFLKPHALDEHTDQQRLVMWYANNGYRRDAAKTEMMEKILPQHRSNPTHLEALPEPYQSRITDTRLK